MVIMLCFFFKQKTAYEMRISDWSSDVCSSDLLLATSSRRQRTIRRTMSDRLTSRLLTSALIRRAGQEGGFATILRKGDGVAGTILLLCLEKGTEPGLFERMSDRTEEHTCAHQSLLRI